MHTLLVQVYMIVENWNDVLFYKYGFAHFALLV